MKKTFYITTVLFSLVLLACQKKPFPDSISQNGAVFYLKAETNGTPVLIEAGSGGYYMYSSHRRNSIGVYQFTSNLKRSDCSDCDEEFSLTLNHTGITEQGQVPRTDELLQPAIFDFATGNTQQMAVQFQSSFNKQGLSYNWDFGDGNSSSEESPLHVYRNPGKYMVCLTVNSTDGCVNQNCYEVDIRENGLRGQISAENLGNNSLMFRADALGAVGGDSLSFHWDFGDGHSGSGKVVTYNYSVPGSYPVSLIIKRSDGVSATVRYNAVTGTDLSSCAANFSAGTIEGKSWEGFGEIMLSWRDKHGVTYSSAQSERTSGDYFEIQEAGDYERNEKGEATKKIKVRFSCNVSDGQKIVELRNCEGVLAVSHP